MLGFEIVKTILSWVEYVQKLQTNGHAQNVKSFAVYKNAHKIHKLIKFINNNGAKRVHSIFRILKKNCTKIIIIKDIK